MMSEEALTFGLSLVRKRDEKEKKIWRHEKAYIVSGLRTNIFIYEFFSWIEYEMMNSIFIQIILI